GGFRDALDRRGRLPLDAHRRHVGASRPDRGGRRGRPAAAAHRAHAGGSAFLRARERGARSARPQRSGAGRGRGARRRGGRVTFVRNWLPAIVVFVVGLAAWQWVLSPLAGKVLLPRPSEI